jgi:hypothetical protein
MPSPCHPTQLSRLARTSAVNRHALLALFGPLPEFDDNCEEQGECEINWDLMPGGDENEEVAEEDNLQESKPKAKSKATSRPTMGEHALKSIDNTRVRLEASWEIEECKTSVASCEDFCNECSGSGRQACRFCRGTNMLMLDTFRVCPICEQGKEDCEPCRGTGFIAPWASTVDEAFGK